jgi:hypothetical protein
MLLIRSGTATWTMTGTGCQEKTMNDDEREDWVNNVESLYFWWKGSGLSMRNFIRQNREAIDKEIQAILKK